MKKITALLLIVSLMALLLGGCFSLEDLTSLLRGGRDTAFSDMEYTRPDMDALQEAFQAVEDSAPSATNVSRLMELVYDVYERYYSFCTNYFLAQIHYSADLTDEYWQEEDDFCSQAAVEVESLLDQMLHTLAKCPLKSKLESGRFFGEGFFDDYQGDSLWDETYTQLMDQEADLQSRYYELNAQALESTSYYEYYYVYGVQMADLYAEMISLRQQIAQHAGYDSYAEYAYTETYGRDYTPSQAQQMLDGIRDNLAPLYVEIAGSDIWELAYQYCSDKTALNYVRATAEALGGTVQKAFNLMEKYGLYDLEYSDNKFGASFTVYLLDYEEPYIFLDPTRSARDKLTFVHEFGHFCNSYATYGNTSGVDVAEVFSQGMEYLSLCLNDTGKLEQFKLADCLGVYVEQAAYAAFEEAAYALENPTRDTVCDLFSQIMQDFGLDVWDVEPLAFTSISHFFTNPMYVLSYVVSNDAAFQLYQLEKQEAGQGTGLYLDLLDYTGGEFLAFVEDAGLESPFAEGRIKSVKETLQAMLTA